VDAKACLHTCPAPTGILRTDLVAATSLWEPMDEVAFQWCDKPPYEQFSTDVESSNESVEAVLNKYKRKNRKMPPKDAPPPPATRCKGVGDSCLQEAVRVVSGLVAERAGKLDRATSTRAAAAALKTKMETEGRKRELEEKKAKADRKKALHRVPDSRERKEAERRIRKKYLAIQMER
jgi:hypothetical protein